MEYIEREIAISYANTIMKNNNIVVLESERASGISCFLKNVLLSLQKSDLIAFYLDASDKKSIAQQIVCQVLRSNNNKEIKDKLLARKNGEILISIFKSFLSILDVTILPNIGSLVNSLLDCVEKSIDVDQEHIKDYKIENAIITFIQKLSSDQKIYFIIDNADKINTNEFDILISESRKDRLCFLFSFSKSEAYSKYKVLDDTQTNLKKENIGIFCRPDDNFVEKIFRMYNKKYDEDVLKCIKISGYDIHYIMYYANGFNTSLKLDGTKREILKILEVSQAEFPYQILYKTLKKRSLNLQELTFTKFNEQIEQLNSNNLIHINIDYDGIKTIEINKRLNIIADNEINFVESQTIINDIIDEMLPIDVEKHLTVSLLKFAIDKLDKDYSKRKKFIFILLSHQDFKQSKYLDMLFDLNDNELLQICSYYYDLEIYDAPYLRLKNKTNLYTNRSYEILMTLLLERKHDKACINKLESLIKTSQDINEKCLLTSVLFVAYLNLFDDGKYKQILNNEKSIFYYENYKDCNYYPYLLRNIAYYMENFDRGYKYYNQSLNYFKNNDPINYNRTLSNYLCFLLRYCEKEVIAQNKLNSLKEEIQKILKFNDNRYVYLSINYGIFLLYSTNEDAEKYFKCLSDRGGTSHTPYIYSQINLAVSMLRKNPIESLDLMNNIEVKVNKSEVPRTKQFYIINRCLIEYANNCLKQDTLLQLKNNPLRGNESISLDLFNNYKQRIDNRIPFTKEDIKKLYLPGFLFYRYFSIGKLLKL